MLSGKQHIKSLTLYLFLSSVAYVYADRESDEDSTIEWTYTEEQIELLELWRSGKGTDLRASVLPESLLAKYGITSKNISPEIYFSNEVQESLSQLPRSERERAVVVIDFPDPPILMGGSSEHRKYLSQFDEASMRKRFAAIAGITNPDNLPPQVLEQIKQVSDTMQDERLEFFGFGQRSRERDARPSQEFLDAVSSLHSVDRARLEPFFDDLVGIQSIYEAMLEMTDEQTRSAFRLLGRLEEQPEKNRFNLPPEEMQKMEIERDQGYGLRLNYPSPISVLREKIELSLSSTINAFKDDLLGRRIYPLDQVESRTLLSELTPVPDTYFDEETESYLIHEKDSGKSTRFYSNTAFGGAMSIEEMELQDVGVYYPRNSP